MDKFDSDKKRCLLDEFPMWQEVKGKSFKIGKLFYLYYEKGMWWFRILGGYGVQSSNLKVKRYILFSERIGKIKVYKIFGRKWKILKQTKLNTIKTK